MKKQKLLDLVINKQLTAEKYKSSIEIFMKKTKK